MFRIRLRVLAVTLLSSAALAAAADPPASAPASQSTSDPNLTRIELELLVKPLTRDELLAEATAWQALLRAKVAEISAAEIGAGRASDGVERTRLRDEAARLREERTQLVDRFQVVLAALKAKGGKTEDFQQYIDAVGGLSVNVTDVSATGMAVWSWLKSGEGGIRYAKNLLLFVITLVAFKFIAVFAGNVGGRAMGAFRGSSQLLRDFMINTTRKVVFFVGFVLALSMLEVNIGPFLAAMGAAGFIIAFALQGTLSNFAAGVMILLYRPYDIGDQVTVAGNAGRVTSMTLVSTVLVNKDGHQVTVPNSTIWGGTIINHVEAGPQTAQVAPK